MNRLAVENPDRLELSTAVVAVAEAPGKRKLQVTTGESPFQVTSHDDDDRGVLEFADGSRLQVERVVFDRDSGFAHIGKLLGAPPTPGTLTHLCVDGDRRRALMAAHAACHTVYGCALRLVGQTFAARSRTGLDTFYSHWIGQGDTPDALIVEAIAHANALVAADAPIAQQWGSRADAIAICGAWADALLPPQAREVRLVRIGADLPWDPCAGLHGPSLAIIPGTIALERVERQDGDARIVMRISAA